MPIGFSLHIGVNNADASHYDNHLEPLFACTEDALAMQQLAVQNNITKTRVLINQDATHHHVISQLVDISTKAISGDFVFITYSGHGSQIPVVKKSTDEDDGFDETWCLFDTQLIDTEMYQALANFRKGVRVLVLLDSCHSGTAIHEWIHASWGLIDHFTQNEKLRFRHVRGGDKETLYDLNKADYLHRQQAIINSSSLKIKASICLIAACQDNQRAIETPFQGMFTAALLMALNNQPKQNYRNLHKNTHHHLHAFQSPNLYTMGLGINNFLKQPFLTL